MKNLSTTLTILFLWLLIPFTLTAVGGKHQPTKPHTRVDNSTEIIVKKRKNRKAKHSPITEEEKVVADKERAAIRSIIFGALGFTLFLLPFSFVGLITAIRVHRWVKAQKDPSKYKRIAKLARIGKILCGFFAVISALAAIALIVYLVKFFILLASL